jgi:hypothetical protein
MSSFYANSRGISAVFAVLIGALAASTPSALAAGETVIYQDTFNRSGNLNGSSPTIQSGANTWSSNGDADDWTASTTNGGQITTTAVSGNRNAFLPFVVASGNVYTYSVYMNNTSGVTNWLAIGFPIAANNATANFYGNPPNPIGWMGMRGNTSSQNFRYLGPGLGGTANIGTDMGANTITVVFDAKTNPTNWAFTWLINGTVVSGPTSYGSAPATV